MENEENPLVLELSRFQELFRAHLDQPSSSESVIMEMLSCLDKSMSLARISVPATQQPTSPSYVEARLMTKKRCNTFSYLSTFIFLYHYQLRLFRKKYIDEANELLLYNWFRKTMTKSTIEQRVVVQAGMGDRVDGHSWRKYGQKNIQYAKYPRCYYRCTHSVARNCSAKKQVQQSDENPSTFEVTYIGTHTCYPSPQQSYPSPQQPDDNPSTFEVTYIETHTCSPNSQQHCLNINTVVSGSDLASPSLLFPSTPESCLDSLAIENCFMGNFSPSPIAAEMSGSNYFSVSEWDMREGPSIQAEGSNFAGNIWAENSAAISPFLDMDMESLLNQGELDPCF